MLGVAADMDAITTIARSYNLAVLEDNCESLGAEWDGKPLGTSGQSCAFSLDFGKVITTGEGGIVTTDDEEVYKLAREYHDHGHESNPAFPRGRDTRRIFGFNYRMTELQAAVGLAQLRKLDFIVERNRQNYAIIEKGLSGIDGLSYRAIPQKCKPLCDTFIFELPSADLARSFVQRMGENGLGTKNVPDAIEWHFAGYWDHLFQQFGITKQELWESLLPSHERLSRCVALPIMVKHPEAQVEETVSKVRKIAKDLL
jgi:8-amino-3,8-dideoxy-alpha-D-manno-octulosonate transaminase